MDHTLQNWLQILFWNERRRQTTFVVERTKTTKKIERTKTTHIFLFVVFDRSVHKQIVCCLRSFKNIFAANSTAYDPSKTTPSPKEKFSYTHQPVATTSGGDGNIGGGSGGGSSIGGGSGVGSDSGCMSGSDILGSMDKGTG